MQPSTPTRQRRPLPGTPEPILGFPVLHPCSSPTPLPSVPQPVFPDLFARASFRTLSAADSLLHLAASPASSPSRFFADSPYNRLSLYSSASTESPCSRSLSHSQSTFPPTPPPTTPSRCILPLDPYRNANVDVLDLSTHFFSSPIPIFASPQPCEPPYPPSTGISPVLHENEKGLKLPYPQDDRLPALASNLRDHEYLSSSCDESEDGKISYLRVHCTCLIISYCRYWAAFYEPFA